MKKIVETKILVLILGHYLCFDEHFQTRAGDTVFEQWSQKASKRFRFRVVRKNNCRFVNLCRLHKIPTTFKNNLPIFRDLQAKPLRPYTVRIDWLVFANATLHQNEYIIKSFGTTTIDH